MVTKPFAMDEDRYEISHIPESVILAFQKNTTELPPVLQLPICSSVWDHASELTWTSTRRNSDQWNI